MSRDYRWRGWRAGDGSALAMAHTGIVVTGAVATPALSMHDTDGRHVRLVPLKGVTELHDLTLVVENGEESIWVADPGFKIYRGSQEIEVRRAPAGGQVLQVDIEGRIGRRLERPDLETYDSAKYIPTAVAVDETRFGGRGEIWVADGYGAGLVHRYTANGRYVASLSGLEGAGSFDQPHDLLIARRRGEPELYVSDRRNQRIQVFDLKGSF